MVDEAAVRSLIRSIWPWRGVRLSVVMVEEGFSLR